jgi:hypothetical protein
MCGDVYGDDVFYRVHWGCVCACVVYREISNAGVHQAASEISSGNCRAGNIA